MSKVISRTNNRIDKDFWSESFSCIAETAFYYIQKCTNIDCRHSFADRTYLHMPSFEYRGKRNTPI